MRSRAVGHQGVSAFFFLVLAAFPATAAAVGLADIYRRAVEVDPGLEQTQKDRLLAELQEEEALAGIFPRLTGEASLTQTRNKQSIGGGPTTTTSFDQQNYAVTLTQPIYSGGRTWIARDIAEVSQSQADAAIRATRQDLMIEVASAYFDVLNAQEEVSLAEREVNRVKEQLERAQARFEVGTGDVVGVREAEATRDQAQTRLIQARNRLQTSREQLRRLIREPLPNLDSLPEVTLEAPQPADSEEWVDKALQSHPRLEELNKQLSANRKEAELASRDRWPELNAEASFTRTEGGSFFTSNQDMVIGINLTWPIYQGGSVSAQTEIERTQAAQTRLQLDDEQQQIRLDTKQAFLDWQSAMQEVRSLRAQVRSARTQLDATETGFEVGRRTSVDVLNAQQDYFGALQQLAEARHSYLLARLQLRAAAGTLDVAALREADRQLQ